MRERDRQYGATVACAEASSGTHADRVAVVWTLFNRMSLRPAQFGATLAGVCCKRMQYSEFNGDAGDNANLERVLDLADDDPQWIDALAAFDEAAAAVAAGQQDPTDGATHYYDHSLDGDPPAWSVAPAVQTLVTDKFTFFKSVP